MTVVWIGFAVGASFGVLRFIGATIRRRDERKADNVVALKPKPPLYSGDPTGRR